MNIDREAVRWAYRLFLNREPENEATLGALAAQVSGYEELKGVFLGCDEYREKNPGLLSGFEPPLQVEWSLSERDQELLFNHVQSTWERLGREEPHWSVLTAEKYKQANIRQFSEDFFASGEADVERLLRTLERCGLNLLKFKSCLELGCGLGRVTCWLEKRFERVVAVDISNEHLAYAAEYVKSSKVAFLHLQSMAQMKTLPKADVVYSVIVLQHNPPPVIAVLLRDLLAALNPGGVAFFQVPTYFNGYSFNVKRYKKQELAAQAMEMHLLPQKQVFEIIAQSGAAVLEVLQDDKTFGLSNTFLVQKA